MANDSKPIIVKRIKKGGDGHHGGAWKVAYADFVTAMMAFFLLLWLLNAVTEEQKKGIADYFHPTIAPESARTAPITIMEGAPNVLQSPTDLGAASEEAEGQKPDSAAGTQAEENNTSGAQAQKNVAEATSAAERKAEQEKFKQAEEQIRQIIQSNPELRALSQNILIDQTKEGLRIQLIDRDKISMFPSGSSVMTERSQELLRSVAKAISNLPNKLAISGHTDAAAFSGGPEGYSNWELSTDRANASRRVLSEAGIGPQRFEAIRGMADTDPLVKEDPLSPQNRRISIVLLKKDAAP
ncbi:MAG TPA: flagellar motor protein MotB [Dongiaceae bacterium]|jgi:chemotaxis protein MotB|nr:flagellar motor protein MotB [Dongiaceae bacterium]